MALSVPRRRDLLVAAATVLAVTAALASPAAEGLRGLSIDTLFWLRHQAVGQRWPTESSPSVVIAIDEEAHRTEPFRGKPQAMWTPELGIVLRSVLDAGAKLVAFDVVFPTSVETILVPDVAEPPLRGFDRGFLRVLRDGAREGRIILGKVQHQELPVAPSRAQSLVVGGAANVRALNLHRDEDDVLRRVPLLFDEEDAAAEGGFRRDPAMSLEAASRALGAPLQPGRDGLRLGGWRVPGSSDNALLINYEGGGGDVPTYSLADIHACVVAGRSDFLARHFAGKIVLLGTVLDVEDRKLTSRRLVNGPDGAGYGPRCVLPPQTDRFRTDLRRDTMPGVYAHAAAINNLVRRDTLAELGAPGEAVVTLALLALGALAALTLPALAAAAAVAGGGAAWLAAATAAFTGGLVLPALTPLIGAAATLAVLLGYRFWVADRDKRQLRRSFALYLPGPVVDRLVRSEKPPSLGGEAREVTVMFSDIAGFTAMAEGLTPEALVGLINQYLDAMTEIVERHGGFVDKYIGDAIVAVFGAPLDDPAHARRGVDTALDCIDALERMNDEGVFAGRRLAIRIGLNSGRALVGNIGSKRRFNYTVMGDAVNLASRLEGVNKVYGTRILASEATAAAAAAVPGPELAWREVDRVRVKGRSAPIAILEPLGPVASLKPETTGLVASYAAALARWREAAFADAARQFAALPDDGPARHFAVEAAALATSGAPPDWEPINSLQTK